MSIAATATATYSVPGITCQHCVNALTAEITRILGVREVAVDLARREVTISSDQPLDRASVAQAVDEAGYDLAD